jgi:phage gp36-like protein
MFLKIEDMPTAMYGYQMEQITEGNDDIVSMAMAAAEEEIRSYLEPNNKKDWLDGRLRYDVEAILSAEDEDRNSLILKHTVTVAKWWIVELCNADSIYEQTKERYDRATDWLKRLANGDVNLSTLPTIDTEYETDENAIQPFSYGSRKKFNHE